jgi:hypothetical protein
MLRELTIAGLAMALCALPAAAECRLMLADQSNYGANLGFYVDLEATSPSNGPCQLSTLTMFTGVANGTAWRWPSYKPAGGWQYGHPYNVVVTIAPTTATMVVDGTMVESPGAFVPNNAPIAVNEMPSWASAPAVFSILEGDLQISNSSGTARYTSPTANLPAAVLALSGPLTGSLPFTTSASDTQVIETSFTLQLAPDQSTPLIDVYGQSVQSTWTGKVATDADLAADDAHEQAWLAAYPPATNVDQWGGQTNAGWSVPGTGFYTTYKRNGYWWLISPAGHPLFYTGLSGPPSTSWDVTPITGRTWEFTNLPAQGQPVPAAWTYDPWGVSDNTYYYAFITSNLIRKFGAANYQALSTARSAARLPSWGFTGLGKWSSKTGALPNLPVIYVTGAQLSTGHVDPWDGTMTQQFRTALAGQIQANLNGVDPSTILGWSWMNEIQGIVQAPEAQGILELSASVPAKQKMIDYGVQQIYSGSVAAAAAAWGVEASTSQQLYATTPTPPAADLEKLREYYENAVHSFVYQAFKTADPHHLYFGFWIVPGWWADPSDWLIAAANCDVLGYDWYSFAMLTDSMKALLAQVDKPTLIGEFSFPPTYNLQRGFGVYPTANAADDQAAGAAYQSWVRQAVSEPTTVGTMWFQYRDEPLAGRGPCPTGQLNTIVCGEHFAFGAADVTDRPKYALVEQMRTANLCATPQRLVFTDPQSGGPAPGTFPLAAPADNASGVFSDAGLVWFPSPGAASYDVRFGTSSPPPLVTNTTATTYSPGALAAGTTYYWQIVADNSTCSTPSATWSFTTAASPPAAPVLIRPGNGATGVSSAPTLSWNPSSGAASYDVYFGVSSTPPLAANITGTSYSLTGLISGTTYYWQIVARNSFGTASSAVWSFTPGLPAPGLRFIPVTPCRLADTRTGATMAGNSGRSFAVPQSGCGIPATAQAYSLNVTAVPEGPLSYLTLWPTGQAQPFVSTLNSLAGDVVANAAIVPAGIGGAVTVYVTDPTDVILDIDGYFDTSASNGLWFYAAPPCRVVDTRGATSTFGGPTMQGGQTRDFPVPLSTCGIPATAGAYSLNFTVVPPGYLGYLSTWPTGQAQPNVSTLNSWKGKVVANAAIVPAGTNDSISVFVSNPSDAILDINGFFGQWNAGALSFYPVTPCRIADTRSASGPFGGPEMGAATTRSFPIPASGCNIPATAAAYSLNVTVVPDGALSYLSVWPTGSAQPLVSTLNSFDGSVVANAAIVPAGTGGGISIYVTNQTHVILDINGYFAP